LPFTNRLLHLLVQYGCNIYETIMNK
jgi:hypothetical protein